MVVFQMLMIDPVVLFKHVKANASKKKYEKVKIEKETRNYQELLDKEISEDRELYDKAPLDMGKKNRATGN